MIIQSITIDNQSGGDTHTHTHTQTQTYTERERERERERETEREKQRKSDRCKPISIKSQQKHLQPRQIIATDRLIDRLRPVAANESTPFVQLTSQPSTNDPNVMKMMMLMLMMLMLMLMLINKDYEP